MGISKFKRHWAWLAEHTDLLWPNPAPFWCSLTVAVPSCSEAAVCCWCSAARLDGNPWWHQAAGADPAPPCYHHAGTPKEAAAAPHITSRLKSFKVRHQWNKSEHSMDCINSYCIWAWCFPSPVAIFTSSQPHLPLLPQSSGLAVLTTAL